MTGEPAFSIITPTCRRPLLLRRNMRSVRLQTFGDYEHIIIDDAPDEETAGVVASQGDARVVFLRHETTRGAAASYNTGIRAARGRFIAFLDDDDEYLPAFLENMSARFQQVGADTGFLWSGISRVRDAGSGERLLHSLVWPAMFSSRQEGLVAATSIGNGFGLCVRRACIDTIGAYDESLEVCEDTDFLFRLAQAFEFATVPEVLVRIHQHDAPRLTGDENFLIRVECRERVLGRYRDFLLLNPDVYYAHHKALADMCYRFGLKRKGRRAMMGIMGNTPFRFLHAADLFFYEVAGKDTAAAYPGSVAQKCVRLVRPTKGADRP